MEAREPRGLEARRLRSLGRVAKRVTRASRNPIERGLEIQEAWKLGNLEVWRLGGLGEALDHLGSILEAYRKRFGNPGGLEVREPKGLEAGKPQSLEGDFPVKGPSWEPIERDLEIQEAWKPGNLKVWRLGGLGEALDDLWNHPGSL